MPYLVCCLLNCVLIDYDFQLAKSPRDAALACLLCCREAIYSRDGHPLLRGIIDRQSLKPSRPFRAIELGSGCGVVGIGLAQLMPSCEVVLTDLPEAQEILMRNTTAPPQLGRQSKTTVTVLNWDEELPETICQKQYDAVLVSDCTYNPDSLPALVRMLGLLSQQSPSAAVVVALKRRHESEAIFFGLMRAAGFQIYDQSTFDLSMSPAGEAGEAQAVEMYVFRRPTDTATTA